MAMNNRQIEQIAQIFRAMGDATRLKILLALHDKELNVTELCRKLRMPQPTVSHHLGLLRLNGLVVNRRSGKVRIYSIREDEPNIFGQVLRRLLQGAAAVRIGPSAGNMAES